MTDSNHVRQSGLSLLAGAIAFVVHIVLRSLITAGPTPATSAQSEFWMPTNLLGVAGALLVLLGLPGVYARVIGPGSRSGLIGVVLLAISWMFFGLFLSLYAVLVMPWLANQAPALIAPGTPLPAAFVTAFLLTMLAWLIGASLLAVPILRGREFPRWVGYLLPASALWMLIGNLVIAPDGPAANPGINLLSNLGPILLMASLGYLGYQARSSHPLSL